MTLLLAILIGENKMKKALRIGIATLALTTTCGIYFVANQVVDRILTNQNAQNVTVPITRQYDEDSEIYQPGATATPDIMITPIFKTPLPEPTPIATIEPQSIGEIVLEVVGLDPTATPAMQSLYVPGRTLDSYFEYINNLSEEEQIELVSELNYTSIWDIILLDRYLPIDGIVRDASAFYETDYKWHFQIMLSESILNPAIIGPTADYGLGQIIKQSENWARARYEEQAYHYSGPDLSDNIFDPYTNIILSSIIYRHAAEIPVADLDAVYSYYTNGFEGISLNMDGRYVVNNFGINDVNRAKSFSEICDRFIVASWVSMERRDLLLHIPDERVRNMIALNNPNYDAEEAYIGMVNALNSFLGESDTPQAIIYDKDLIRGEIGHVLSWLESIYDMDTTELRSTINY